MIRSMTGFGKSEIERGLKRITVEIKSVNNRYLDVSMKMPKSFNQFEGYLRSLLKNYVERGKLDIFIYYEDYSDVEDSLLYNEDLAKKYIEYIDKMCDKFDIDGEPTIGDMLRCQDVFVMRHNSLNEEELKPLLKEAMEEALKMLVNARSIEGENLKEDLLSKVNDLSKYVDFIESKGPLIIEEYKNKLTLKVKDMLEDSNIEDSRIAMEVTLFADKIAIDEEIVRLKSHVDTMKKVFEEGGSIGRKLDFITQEMNREANTILSKSTDIDITNVGIELKTLIEKIREQIQNLE